MNAKLFIGILCIAAVTVVVFLVVKKKYVEDDIFIEAVVSEEEEVDKTEDAKNINTCEMFKTLVNIQDIDSAIFVELKYATVDNFTGVVLYENLDIAYLQYDVALMLAEAHRYLKTLNPELRFLVYDAVRPLSVQQIMWDRVKDTPFYRYIAPPERLSLHNFGAAVDLTIADSLGQPLDMGTPFDHFGRAAGISEEDLLIEQGILTQQQVQNRQLLRKVMQHAGFITISGEWWHFNACSLQEAKERYTLVN